MNLTETLLLSLLVLDCGEEESVSSVVVVEFEEEEGGAACLGGGFESGRCMEVKVSNLEPEPETERTDMFVFVY